MRKAGVVVVLLQVPGGADPVPLLSVQHWSIFFSCHRNELQVNKDGCSVTPPQGLPAHTHDVSFQLVSHSHFKILSIFTPDGNFKHFDLDFMLIERENNENSLEPNNSAGSFVETGLRKRRTAFSLTLASTIPRESLGEAATSGLWLRPAA